jgi:hypothetical protein
VAFTVEDGTGVTDANSLCSVSFADAYFAERGVVAWTGSSTVKEQALVKATDYIETRFAARFKGEVADAEQALSWPRINAGADDIVPIAVRKAASEYASRALTAVLAPDPVMDETGRSLQSKTEKVGPILESTVYSESTSVQMFKPYPAADALLRPYLKYNGGVVRN